MNPTESHDVASVRADGSGVGLGAIGVTDGALCGALLDWMERSGLLLSVKDIASGRYVHVNDGMAALLGRREDPAEADQGDVLDQERPHFLRPAAHVLPLEPDDGGAQLGLQLPL